MLIGLFLFVIIVVTLLRMVRRLTTMRQYSCAFSQREGKPCDISRIPRNRVYRTLSVFLPLKRYSCHDCGRKFTRLLPLFDSKEND